MIDFGRGVQLGNVDEVLAFHWRNDPQIYKWCRQFEPLSYDKHMAWAKSLKDRADVRMFGVYVGGACVGTAGLTSINSINGSAEFSLYIGPEHQENGYGAKALQTLVDYGFKVLRLHHIFGESFAGNPALRMFEQIGFVREGTRRQYYFREGKYIDAHVFSVLSTEWI